MSSRGERPKRSLVEPAPARPIFVSKSPPTANSSPAGERGITSGSRRTAPGVYLSESSAEVVRTNSSRTPTVAGERARTDGGDG